MAAVLADPELYTFTGGRPPSRDELEVQYRAQVAGPATGGDVWHNWILRLAGSGDAVGFVQATVTGEAADVAWVVATAWQGRGLATEAVLAMCDWLQTEGITTFTAHIHPHHAASRGVATAVGLHPTAEVDGDGEVVWTMLTTARKEPIK